MADRPRLVFRLEIDILQHCGEHDDDREDINRPWKRVSACLTEFPPLRSELHFASLWDVRKWLADPAVKRPVMAHFDGDEWSNIIKPSDLRPESVLVLPTSADSSSLEEMGIIPKAERGDDSQPTWDVFNAVAADGARYRRQVETISSRLARKPGTYQLRIDDALPGRKHAEAGDGVTVQSSRGAFSEGGCGLTVAISRVSIMSMSIGLPLAGCRVGFWLLPALVLLGNSACADWQREENAIAWRVGTNVMWGFCYDSNQGKPCFSPLVAPGGVTLTSYRPEDHRWHYSLWFSWKIINQVNYWDENRPNGRAEGTTRWTKPAIETTPDGGAVVALEVTYVTPSGRVDMTEKRDLRISAPAADGSYDIHWHAQFTAGKEGALLDRTPMLGEPGGLVNGGYGGLGLRLAPAPLSLSIVCSTGLVSRFESDRARPNAAALACNFMQSGTNAGGIAIFSDPANAGAAPPWYLVNSEKFRFACAAILAPKPIQLAPGAHLNLRYRIMVRGRPWTAESLQAGF